MSNGVDRRTFLAGVPGALLLGAESALSAPSAWPISSEANASAVRKWLQSQLDRPAPRMLHIPKGVWWLDQALVVRSQTTVLCEGVLMAARAFKGVGATGSLVAIRHARNVAWRGGTLNGNSVAVKDGFNGLTISAPQADRAGRTENVLVEGVQILNCRRDPGAPVGAGGGKGFTIQFGVSGCRLKAISIRDCDFAFSLEGRLNHAGSVYGVDMDGVDAVNCPYGIGINGTSGGDRFLRARANGVRISGASLAQPGPQCGNADLALGTDPRQRLFTCFGGSVKGG